MEKIRLTDANQPGPWERRLDRTLKVSSATAVENDASGRSELHRPISPGGSDRGGVAEAKPQERSLSVDELRHEFVRSIKAGMTLADDIYDGDVLLLAGGSRIDRRFLELLRQRNIKRVRLRPPKHARTPPSEEAPPQPLDPSSLHTNASRVLDERSAGELARTYLYHPVRPWRRPRLEVDDLKEQAAIAVGKHNAVSTAVGDVASALKAGRRMSVGELRQSMTQFVDMASLDFDLLPMVVAMQDSRDEYLYTHSVNTALICIGMASQLGLDRSVVTMIGLGGLLQDIGMLRVPESIRLAPRKLTEPEWQEIHRHPLHTLDMLSNLTGLSQTVRYMAYHAHERINGSGYPRGRSDNQVHEFAKIASLADAYTAMTADRPHRPALTPYLAVKTILADGARNRYDRTLVRALLDTVSLFPIGSRVELDDGTTARVLRVSPGLHTKPTVEALTPDGTSSGQIIDLSQEGAPAVVKAF